ncbi:MAG TPA: DeoR family transcriptional regulator [Candidatus Paceibacterota bacterium]|nr:DeoR family transcriptional regulator [Candidatus Paceibacterota bacterium]
MVTNFLSDMEPIKWKIREACLDTVSDKNLNGQFSDSLKAVSLDQVSHKLRTVLKMLDTVSATGSVSEMNVAILKQEYAKLLASLEQEMASSMNRYVSHLLPPVPPQADLKISASSARQNFSPAPSSMSDRRIENGTMRPASTPVSSREVSVNKDAEASQDEAKSARKNQITSYLEGRNWTSIKDIATQIKGCSQKTVQRDLAELVDRGVLRKQGERRWSRYVLVK